jgi:Ca2+-binding RTX toxin-like protein
VLAGADGARAAAVSAGQELMMIVNVDFAAAPGEVNDVTMTSGADRVLTVRDASASLTAGAGCTAVDTHTVTCPPGPTRFTAVHADLGDMNDAISVPAGTAAELLDVTAGSGNDVVSNGATPNPALRPGEVTGGDGNDVITAPGDLFGGPGDDTVTGSDAADIIKLGPGRDVGRGLGGDDFVCDGDSPATGLAADTLDGGPGIDTVCFADDPAPPSPPFSLQPALHGDLGPLLVSLQLSDPRPTGLAGDPNVLASIENIAGGSQADELTGDGGPNLLQGYEGDDRLVGRGGRDLLIGGQGNDRIAGGGGDDKIDARSPGAVETEARESGVDLVDCGAGFDAVYGSNLWDELMGCERLVALLEVGQGPTAGADIRRVAMDPRVRLKRGVLSLAVPCSREFRPRESCRGVVSVWRGRPASSAVARPGAKLGSAQFAARQGRTARVAVKLSAKARRYQLKVRFKRGPRIFIPGGEGAYHRVAWTWTTRPAR